ncbi:MULTISPECIES: hypothetical protein [Mucilaginibacter]|uniref:Uncharacterized protein n=1 Tax=Mucilaginibacter rubeus TaxID=2027860 RepID=A0ABX7U6Q0_9SPHI|nr:MULTISPECIES: hypothetical protein [Mucilaginibacter]QTE40665.1 hypothetical protein J3L19_16955 [Mucilaginibacter rubeus]QTE47267.1 hypothetical protein J3L21_16930 [Mucilaginibacter rubeus]QTE58660.1 hypothetical protein J3L23_08600 [Mucilaginibacter rubeus]QTE61881.1 hypothetical protein J3L22_25265 [Mucilaginibacter rubeus]QTF60638.1 hypothetical protein J3L20_24895 [Mucilaginibacter rubeus]
MDISSRESVQSLIKAARKEREIAMFINAAGVSPSQASIEQILKVDLYGTALLLEEFGKVIKYLYGRCDLQPVRLQDARVNLR